MVIHPFWASLKQLRVGKAFSVQILISPSQNIVSRLFFDYVVGKSQMLQHYKQSESCKGYRLLIYCKSQSDMQMID